MMRKKGQSIRDTLKEPRVIEARAMEMMSILAEGSSREVWTVAEAPMMTRSLAIQVSERISLEILSLNKTLE